MRAHGQEYQARAQYFPQLNFSGGYQRTIESQFSAISKSGSSDSSSSSGSGSSGTGSSNGSLANISKIFAAPNTVTLGLTFSQNLFTAGKVTAANKGAEASRTVAQIGLDAARAQLVLDVAQAYFDAVASDQLVQIADSTLVQAERTLQQTTVSRQVGSAAEFDLLRARVARDNQRPVVIQARGNRDLAFLRLRQLLGIPLGQPLALTTPIRDDGTADAEPAPLVLSQPILFPGGDRGLIPDTSVGRRSSVRQAEANVTAQEYALRAARWERLPSFQITSLYQRFGYPAEGTILPSSFAAFYPNWTATLGFSFPVFTGGRLTGDRMLAEANLIEARQAYEQTQGTGGARRATGAHPVRTDARRVCRQRRHGPAGGQGLLDRRGALPGRDLDAGRAAAVAHAIRTGAAQSRHGGARPRSRSPQGGAPEGPARRRDDDQRPAIGQYEHANSYGEPPHARQSTARLARDSRDHPGVLDTRRAPGRTRPRTARRRSSP